MIEAYEEVLKKNGTLVFTPGGTSMMPLLKHHENPVVLMPVEGRLKKGDVPFYKRENGQYVLHRILKVKRNSYVTCGDNRYFTESGVTDDQIIGVLECVIRDGERIAPSDPEYIRELEKKHSGRLFKGVMLELKRRVKRK